MLVGEQPQQPKSPPPPPLSAAASWSHYKLAGAAILAASIAALFLLRSSGDTVALLCLSPSSSSSSHPTSLPYPQISFTSVPTIAPLPPFASFRSDRWIVASVSSPPTPALRRLVKLKSWQLLAVGNSRTPAGWSLKGAIFLSLDDQARLSLRSVARLPYASYVRKSAGYLFAVLHGARLIFDADDRADLIPPADNLSLLFDLNLNSPNPPPLLQYSLAAVPNRTVVNPYIHFGQRSVWPRGLPLDAVGEVAHEEFYDEVRGGRQFIQQGISNGLPDVDSVFYFTRKTSEESSSFDIRFDGDAPKVALPQGLMAPVNSFNTLFHSQAFWGLMLPVSVSSMASDVIRGYWAQRILWEIGGSVAFYPPTIHRPDNAEAYPFAEEKDLHLNVGRLVKFLISWRSDKKTLFERILDLSYAMAEEGFWSEQDVKFTADWLQDLIAVGYQQPKLVSLELDRPKASSRVGDLREFVPRKLPSVHLGVEEAGTVNYEIGNLVRWRKNFGNVVLIMHCGGTVERTALEWRLLYGRIFKSVVILSEQSNLDLAVDYGRLMKAYKYLPKVFEQFPGAEGFFFLQDDMILNYWNLLQADKAKLWITNKVPQSWVNFSIDSNSPRWLRKQGALVKKVVNTFPVHFQVSYKENMGEERLIVCSSEIFYVPQRLVGDFIDLVGLVGDLDIHHKVAVPMFFLAMDSPQNFDSDALATIVYRNRTDLSGSNFSLHHYTYKVPAVYPLKVQNESDFLRLIGIMALGDPLLMELV